MSTDPLVSTGRGGAGNIGHDPTVYTDASVVRENLSDTLHEPHSGGRGGAGNIKTPTRGTPNLGPRQDDAEVIPEGSLRAGEGQSAFHTGRGGGGNVYKEGHVQPAKEHKEGAEAKPSFGDKVKHALHLDKSKKTDAPAESK